MKTGIAVLTGLLVADGVATGFKIDVGGCQTQKTIEYNTLSCPCAGGSGNFDWHFTELPKGWTAQGDKIVATLGKVADKKVYSTKVEVIDKDTNESVKKSLFFNFENGKLKQIVDGSFDFDVSYLYGKPAPATITQAEIDNIVKLFANSYGVGGGNGLTKLDAYLLGSGAIYSDANNPYLNTLPTGADIDNLIASASTNDLKTLIVNSVRSKVSCK